MSATQKRQTYLTVDANLLDSAHNLGIDISAAAEEALRRAVADAQSDQSTDHPKTFPLLDLMMDGDHNGK